MAKGVFHVHTYSQTALAWEEPGLNVLNYLTFYSKLKQCFLHWGTIIPLLC